MKKPYIKAVLHIITLALGAALMCALALGLADEDIGSYRTSERVFAPSLDRTYFDGLYAQYLAAVRRALG